MTRVAVVGDSLSVGFSPSFTADGLDRTSYLYAALGDDAVLAGGTAVPGATSLHQRSRAEAVEADVLILALGTNDLAWGLPFDETAGALRDIAATVGPPPRVILLAIPPLEPELGPTTPVYNAWLSALAEAEGWEFVDAPAPVRDGDGWAPGMSNDGVHYTARAARLVGEKVGRALRAAAT
ncbi:SGNH/GDSL hydrolase family protein [Demequina rhizosphaerae]|uniref:SGNH/GDSL hydrolase family protein n=1 Tax=Demequina rhizosphaerae TaxID=1638985 RepID=UPI000B17749D|nr:SGNH/GDSL hydrolase family protein [Demequina rhizosphaerae]